MFVQENPKANKEGFKQILKRDGNEFLEKMSNHTSWTLTVTLSLTEDRAAGLPINSLIAVKRKDGNMEYCVVTEKKRGDNDTWLYVLKERDSDRQVTVDLDTLDWSFLTEGNGK